MEALAWSQSPFSNLGIGNLYSNAHLPCAMRLPMAVKLPFQYKQPPATKVLSRTATEESECVQTSEVSCSFLRRVVDDVIAGCCRREGAFMFA